MKLPISAANNRSRNESSIFFLSRCHFISIIENSFFSIREKIRIELFLVPETREWFYTDIVRGCLNQNFYRIDVGKFKSGIFEGFEFWPVWKSMSWYEDKIKMTDTFSICWFLISCIVLSVYLNTRNVIKRRIIPAISYLNNMLLKLEMCQNICHWNKFQDRIK